MRALPVTMLAALAVAGCGGSSGTAPTAARRAPTPPGGPPPSAGSPTDAQVRAALRIPARVPLRATGAARPADVAVVRRWLDLLRAGDVRGAARVFAVPSRFQNFTDVALIRTPAQALVVTASLPCGARMTRSGGAAGFVVYEARLTRRPGASCGAGVGGVVRGAVLVRGGRIAEWYRLPDARAPRPAQPPQPAGPIV